MAIVAAHTIAVKTKNGGLDSQTNYDLVVVLLCTYDMAVVKPMHKLSDILVDALDRLDYSSVYHTFALEGWCSGKTALAKHRPVTGLI
jgi:hypothetical protein